jgi:DNA-binding MarR family transcriptional regulator
MKPNPTKIDRAATKAAEPELVLEAFLPYRLSVLSNRVSGAIGAVYASRFKLGIAEWRLMAALGRFGPMSANEVADRTAMDKVRVSRAVARMVENGLLERTLDASDRRRSMLSLSPSGRAIRAEIVPLALAIERRLMSVLDAAERATFDRLLEKLESSAATAFVDGDPLP